MHSPLTDLLGNRVLWAAVAGWLVAQGIKVLLALIITHKFEPSYLFASGGMPSSHSALVTGLATGAARVAGMGSVYFALAAVFAGVVMYDAAGVRRAVSKQARILNLMMDDFFHERGLDVHRLGELIGHTPVEVFAGAALGILLGLLFTA
ncbi:MAG TPA: divergent PAP2 family protein [Ktedonobacterales bacterium]